MSDQTPMKRRDFAKSIAVTALASSALSTQQSKAEPAPKPLEIGMLLYPQLTLLDLIGPQTVLSQHANIHLVWKTTDPIQTDSGILIQPNATFEECPRDLDVLFVPGGPGMIPVMRDADVLRFLADRGARARFVTSVCSGSVILGAAGLLRDYQATFHWAAVSALPLFGAKPTAGRVVTDRNRLTGGGVTAGIDFGLVLLAKLRGEETAKMTQLAMEYDPQPPFHAGSPSGAGPEMTERLRAQLAPLNEQIRQIAVALLPGENR